jgi:hypothetical protein
MPEVPKFGDLQVDQDLQFQRRERLVQRIGWALLALFLTAGMLGLLGHKGPLSESTISLPGGRGELTYFRFLHNSTPTSLELDLTSAARGGSEIRIAVSQSYLKYMQVEHVTPQPDHVEISGDEYVYVFRAAEAESSAIIRFELNVNTVGRLNGWLRIGSDEALEFQQFSYP